MWAIIKVNKKKLNLFENDFKRYFDPNFQIYSPKFKINKSNKNNSKIFKDLPILGDYIFCFHHALSIKNKLNYVKRFRGLKLFVDGHIQSQKEILEFIDKCKKNEDNDGYLLQDFFDKEINKKYELVSGPFAKKIFSIISLQKNKLLTKIGNIRTTIKTKDFLFRPI